MDLIGLLALMSQSHSISAFLVTPHGTENTNFQLKLKYHPVAFTDQLSLITQAASVAQSVERPISSQVMISWFMGLSPASGSLLTAQSLQPALDSVSPSLSAPPLLTLCLSLSQK